MGIRNPLALAGLGALTVVLAVQTATTTRPGAEPALPAAQTAAAPADAAPVIDGRGFVHSSARCEAGQTAVAVGRTRRSQVVICTADGAHYTYRGVRTGDNAELHLNASRIDGGFVARADGADYTVSPDELVVVSGGKVIYRDGWIQYTQPGHPSEQ